MGNPTPVKAETFTVNGEKGISLNEYSLALLRRKKRKEAYYGYLYLLPATAILICFWFLPTLYAFIISFFRWDFMNPVKTFVGFGNYIHLLTSREFWRVMFNTGYYMVGAIPLTMLISLILALALNEKIKGLAFFRAAIFAPVISCIIAMSAVWLWMYDPINGLLNYFLQLVGLDPLQWFSDTQTAMPALILFDIWKHTGYDMIIYLAGIQSISESYYEAAKIDGAGRWDRFRHITWPLLGPTTLFILIISIIRRFQVFSVIHTMTQGGPAGATDVVVYYLYEKAFQDFEMGYAFAISYILFIFIFVVTLIQWKVGAKKVHYAR
jgi:ABC-type sugar transport system permease subunit